MSFRKMFKRAVRASYNPKTAFKSATNPAFAAGADGKPPAQAGYDPDYKGQLDKELAHWGKIGDEAKAGVEADARTAGTYADNPAFKIQAQGQADAEAKGMKRVSLQKINALQKQLGMPETAADQI